MSCDFLDVSVACLFDKPLFILRILRIEEFTPKGIFLGYLSYLNPPPQKKRKEKKKKKNIYIFW